MIDPSVRTCFECSADVSGRNQCPACLLPQTAEVAGLHERATRAEQRYATLQSIFAIGLVVALALGAGVATMLTTPRATIIAQNRQAEALLDEPIEVDAVNDMFRREIDRHLRLGLRGWIRHAATGTIIFEMDPSPEGQPSPLWETLSATERREVAQSFAAAYTTTLFQTGNPVDVETDGHPPVALRYHGTSEPVAFRAPDGTVHIYPSPPTR